MLLSLPSTGDEEPCIYANLFRDSPLFLKLSYQDLYDVEAEMEFERLITEQFKDGLSSKTLSEIEKKMQDKEFLLKVFFMKFRELAKPRPDEKALKLFYRKNLENYTIPEKCEIWYTFISSYITPDTQDWKRAEREKARVEELLKTCSMESLAEELHTPTFYGNKCLKLEGFPRGRHPKRVDDIIFSLKEGKGSEFFKTPKGFAKVKVLKIYPSQVKPYEEVEKSIRQKLISETDRMILSNLRNRLSKKYHITYGWDEWKKNSEQAREKELRNLCKKLSLSPEISRAFHWQTFENRVFDLLLVKEFELLAELEKKDYGFMRRLLKNRYAALKCLDYLSFKKCNVEVGEDELLEFYNSHPTFFYQKGIIEARMATIKSSNKDRDHLLAIKRAEKIANEFYERLLKGESFVALAKKYSEDKFAKNGGRVGIVDEGKSRMGAIFDINAFELKEGEFTKPLLKPGRRNYIIIKVDKVIREKKLLPFEQVKNRVKEVYRKFQQQKILKALADKYFAIAKKKVPEETKGKGKIILHTLRFNWF